YEYTLDDYLGINLFSEKELSDMRRGAQKLQKQLQDAGLKTELVIFIAPNHATIYPETMPDFLAEKKVGQDSRAKQMLEAFEGSGIKVIFPYEALLREKGDNLLYFLADTHWNELGAYFGYFELFGYIGEKFPDAAPLPQSELDIYETTMYGGDIISNMLFFDSYSYTSTTTAARIKSPKAAQTELVGDPGTGYQVWKNESKPDLPTIAMYRDSFSVAMLGFMAESSGKLVVNSMWDFDIDMAQLKELNPDYLIIEKVERETRSFSVLFR
ncbi:MAG: hypothetical protein FWH48_04250, partial [Oscillospiraceae bacterium]|nr:hypothetical protein [Oscillospiraceae bacterium]